MLAKYPFTSDTGEQLVRTSQRPLAICGRKSIDSVQLELSYDVNLLPLGENYRPERTRSDWYSVNSKVYLCLVLTKAFWCSLEAFSLPTIDLALEGNFCWFRDARVFDITADFL